jgi:hypothetical protein
MTAAKHSKTAEDLYADGTLPNTCRVLVLEGRAGCGNIMENIQIYTCQVAAVFPSSPHFALQVKKRDLVSGDVRDTGDLRVEELG